jgi:indole-3-glycerol phosphate synthase
VNLLDTICTRVRQRMEERRAHFSLADLEAVIACAAPTRGFARALSESQTHSTPPSHLHNSHLHNSQGPASTAALPTPRLITEIKRASPSAGLLREPYDPAGLARSYESAGATCLSVLTEQDYFQGSLEDMATVRAACTLPILRKDFMVDPYQVAEARAFGADCVLLIMAALDDGMAVTLEAAAQHYGLDVLVEVHTIAELERALSLLATPLLGVNSRDLKTLRIDLAHAEHLRGMIPADRLAVAESGIKKPDDIRRLQQAGYHAFLVGEALLRAPDPAAATRVLLHATG